MNNFWLSLKKPIYVLAPMEDVTDTVFRQIIAKCAKPDVFFTEFTSVEGMFSKGKTQVNQRLRFMDKERPLVAQIWGLNPVNFYKAAKKLVTMGFDGIDLNMGCPDKGVIQKGACSALIKNKILAKEIIEATKKGSDNKIPVSVKTRLGFRDFDSQWIRFLFEQEPAALTVHVRTVADKSKVPARWEFMKKISEIKHVLKSQTILIGNGDIKCLSDASEKIFDANIDGVMIGRGIFDNPYLFSGKISLSEKNAYEKLQLLLDHVRLWDVTWGKTKHFPTLRKFFKIYANGFPSAQELRIKLMNTKNAEQTENTIQFFLEKSITF